MEDAVSIVPHEAAEKSLKFPYDTLFGSLNQYLLDSVTSEWLFCIEWFGPNDLFPRLFSQPLQLCISSIGSHIAVSYDAVGLLLMLKMTSRNKKTMVRRGISVLVKYFDTLEALIRPRLLEVLNLNIQSVKLFLNDPSVNNNTIVVEMRVHFIIRRYSEMITAMLQLTKDFKHPDVMPCLNVLRQEIVAVLDRMGKHVKGNPKERQKNYQIFIITNLDLILSLLRDKDLVSTETVILEEKMEQTISSYVHAQLNLFFKPLFNFVKNAEQGAQVEKEAVEAIIKSIHKTWKGDVKRLVEGVIVNGFSNFSLAAGICRKLLFELTKCNAKTWDIIKEAFGPNAFTKFYLAPFQIRDEFSNCMKSMGLLLEI
jgi:hypothetical protein